VGTGPWHGQALHHHGGLASGGPTALPRAPSCTLSVSIIHRAHRNDGVRLMHPG
jgi:hypothetical protein